MSRKGTKSDLIYGPGRLLWWVVKRRRRIGQREFTGHV